MTLALLHRLLPLPRTQKHLHHSNLDRYDSVAPKPVGLTDHVSTEDECLWGLAKQREWQVGEF